MQFFSRFIILLASFKFTIVNMAVEYVLYFLTRIKIIIVNPMFLLK